MMRTYRATKDEIERTVTLENAVQIVEVLGKDIAPSIVAGLRHLYEEKEYQGAALLPPLVAGVRESLERVATRLVKHIELSDLWDERACAADLQRAGEDARLVVVCAIMLKCVIDQHVFQLAHKAGIEIKPAIEGSHVGAQMEKL